MGSELTVRYFAAKWRHSFLDEPIEIFSEVRDGRETRKVEVFADGHMGYADEFRESGDTFLSEGPMPELSEINAQEEFDAREISAERFDQIWEIASSD